MQQFSNRTHFLRNFDKALIIDDDLKALLQFRFKCFNVFYISWKGDNIDYKLLLIIYVYRAKFKYKEEIFNFYTIIVFINEFIPLIY